MGDLGYRLAALIEERMKIRPLRRWSYRTGDYAQMDGKTIAVIGGGLAGPAFAHRVLSLSAKLDFHVKVILLTRPSCNYCAGLITNLSLQTMRDLYGLPVPTAVVKEAISEVVYMNNHGEATVPLLEPLTSVLRTSRFKQQGFDESWVTNVFENLAGRSEFELHQNSRVTAITRRKNEGFTVAYEEAGSEFTLDADNVVFATGLKSIQGTLMQRFIAESGYQPPGLMDACVTEIDTSRATHYDLDGRVLVVDGVIPHCIVAFIPKGKGWLTITGLGKILADHDLETLFNHPLVKKYIDMDRVVDRLRCRKICSAGVVVRPASRFFGDGWAIIGDLTGYGRALKDGYFAALQSADLAARTLVFHGGSKAAFEQHYFKPLRRLALDNCVGMFLFRLDQKIIKGRMGTFLLCGALREMQRERRGGLITAAFRALFSGELSYKLISTLFATGTALHIITGQCFRSKR